jgi:hypothetical protein
LESAQGDASNQISLYSAGQQWHLGKVLPLQLPWLGPGLCDKQPEVVKFLQHLLLCLWVLGYQQPAPTAAWKLHGLLPDLNNYFIAVHVDRKRAAERLHAQCICDGVAGGLVASQKHDGDFGLELGLRQRQTRLGILSEQRKLVTALQQASLQNCTVTGA